MSDLVNITAIPGSMSGRQDGTGLAERRLGAGDEGFQRITDLGLDARFLARFLKYFTRPENGCWVWTASVNSDGYGQIARPDGGGPIKAHRVAWMLAHGPIGSHQHVLHRCDVPRCVNPGHLFLGDQAINMKDAAAKGRLHTPRPNRQRISDDIVAAILTAPAERGVVARLARKFGVSSAFVSLVRRGLRRQFSPVGLRSQQTGLNQQGDEFVNRHR